MTRVGDYPVSVEMSPLRIGPERIAIDIHVRNDSDRSLLVVEEIRAIRFDRPTSTLEIWLSDDATQNPAAPQGVCRAISKPNTRELPAGTTVDLSVSVPRQLFSVEPGPDGTAVVEHADLGEATSASVHVTVADRPFYYRPSGADPRAQIAKWGRTHSAKAIISPSQARSS